MIFIWILITLHIFLAAFMQYRVAKTADFNKRQRIVNSILLWFIPFLWSLILFYTIGRSKIEVVTQDMQKQIRENWGQPNRKGPYS